MNNMYITKLIQLKQKLNILKNSTINIKQQNQSDINMMKFKEME